MQYQPTPWTKVEAERQTFPANQIRTRLVRSAWMAFYTAKGTWEISVPGCDAQLKPGDIAWIPSGMIADQRYIDPTVTLTVRIRAGAWVSHADGEREVVELRQKLDNTVRRIGPVLPVEERTSAQVRMVFREWVREWRRPEAPLHRSILKSCALRFFYLLSEDPLLAEELEAPMEADPRKEAEQRVTVALQLLNNLEYLQSANASVEELAKACGYKNSRFHHLFVQATGLTPNRYLTECRVELACQLLADPEKSILDVAYGSGFGTQSRFYLAFKQITGMTPGTWRNRQS